MTGLAMAGGRSHDGFGLVCLSGVLLGWQHVYSAYKVLTRAERQALPPSCSLTCVKRLSVALSNHS